MAWGQVDHIMVQVPDPEQVFQTFSEGLGLPVAWPMQDYGSFQTGGVSFGNVNMEVLNFSDELKRDGLVPSSNGIIGIAIDPGDSLESVITSLDAAHIPHGEIVPFDVSEDGTSRTLWRNLDLAGMMPGSQIFYCQYTFDQKMFRKHLGQQLAASQGGPLGILGMAGIAIDYSDDSVPGKWKKILPEAAGNIPDTLDGGEGLVVHLNRSDRTAISSISVKVRSLEEARTFSRNKGWRFSEAGGKLAIDPVQLAGIMIFLATQ